MKRIYGSVLLISVLDLCNVAAAEGDWYAGVSLGTAEANEIGFEDIDDGSALSGSIDDNDFGWKIFGGYAYNQYVAIEGAYVDLGEVSINAESDGGGVSFDPGPVTAAIKATGFSLSVIGFMPINERLGLHAKIGYFAWEADQSLSNSAFQPVSVEFDGSDPTFGVGATYEVNDRLAIRGEYEKYVDIDEVDGSLFSLGLQYAFSRK
jgi:OOP family OmpA-OmpF porin